MDDVLKTKGIIYLNVETGLLFAPLSKCLATCLYSMRFTHTKVKT